MKASLLKGRVEAGESERRREALRKRCEEDLYHLAVKVLGYGFLHEPLHRKMCEFAEETCAGAWDGKDAQWSLLLAPRGHGKSTLYTAAHAIQLQLKARDPTFAVGITHAVKPLAVRLLSDVKAAFERNALLKWIAPDLCWEDPEREAEKWKADEIVLKRSAHYRVPSYVAFGLGATQVGAHFDVIKGDDLVIDENSETGDQREKVKLAIAKMKPLLKATGWRRIHLTGTRWDVDDVYGDMTADSGPWAGRVKVMVLDCYLEDGSLAWPRAIRGGMMSGFTKEEFEEMEGVNPYLFSCNYRNNPIPRESAAFDPDNVQRYTVEYEDDGSWRSPDDLFVNMYTAVDPNIHEDTAHDAASVITAARDHQGRMWVVDIDHGHPSPSELILWMRRHVQTFRPQELLLETVQAQHNYIHWLERDTLESGVNYPTREVKRGGPHSKYSRIVALGPMLRGGRLFVPRGKKFEPIMEEIARYSPKANVDDCLDCLADIYQYGSTPQVVEKKPKPPRDPWLLGRLLGRNDPNGLGVREAQHGVRRYA